MGGKSLLGVLNYDAVLFLYERKERADNVIILCLEPHVKCGKYQQFICCVSFNKPHKKNRASPSMSFIELEKKKYEHSSHPI